MLPFSAGEDAQRLIGCVRAELGDDAAFPLRLKRLENAEVVTTVGARLDQLGPVVGWEQNATSDAGVTVTGLPPASGRAGAGRAVGSEEERIVP